jgi:hypothetical protein
VSDRAGRVADRLIAVPRAESLRRRLEAEMGTWTAHLAHDAATLAVLNADPSDDPSGLNRAMTALHMYDAVVAIEEIEDALLRLGQRTDAASPPRSAPAVARVVHDPRVLAASRARHPSSVRHEHAPGPNRDVAAP